MLVINPDECIDCGVCEPECPIDAIKADNVPIATAFLELNRDFSMKWPNLTRKKPALLDADQWKDVNDKYPMHFSAAPGEGD